jgi:hypothetical protein
MHGDKRLEDLASASLEVKRPKRPRVRGLPDLLIEITPKPKIGEGETKVNIKTVLKSSVAVAALFAVAAPAANADIKNGNKNSLTVSGQVVRAIFHADDGVSEKTFQSGGNIVGSRVRWVASGKVNDNVTVGATIEMDIPISNTSVSAVLGSEHADGAVQGDTAAWGMRHQYIWVNHKKFGKLSIGNTDPAANGASEADFTGTGMFTTSDGDSYGSGILFQNTSTASAPSASAITVGASIHNLDGVSRTDVIRYDTPRFMGLQVKVGAIAGGQWDFGANYAGKFGPVKVKARAGYTNQNMTNATANFMASGSLAVLHDSGLLASFAIGKQNFSGPASKSSLGVSPGGGNLAIDTNNNGTEDPSFMYWGIGYNAKIFSAGQTAFYFKWNQTKDFVQVANNDDNEANARGFAVTQKFSAIGASIGLEYMNYEYESKTNITDNTFADVDVISLMTIFAF